jgi:hypothetical protein
VAGQALQVDLELEVGEHLLLLGWIGLGHGYARP